MTVLGGGLGVNDDKSKDVDLLRARLSERGVTMQISPTYSSDMSVSEPRRACLSLHMCALPQVGKCTTTSQLARVSTSPL